MPSWVWIVILLIVIAAAWVGAVWYAHRLAAQNDHPHQGDTTANDESGDAPAGVLVARKRRTPSPSTIPPPALAGPLREAPGAPRATPTAISDELPAPRTSQADASRTSTRPSGGPPRTTKAPPVQAAWSAPQKNSNDGD